jgi:hypothetical protein
MLWTALFLLLLLNYCEGKPRDLRFRFGKRTGLAEWENGEQVWREARGSNM